MKTMPEFYGLPGLWSPERPGTLPYSHVAARVESMKYYLLTVAQANTKRGPFEIS